MIVQYPWQHLFLEVLQQYLSDNEAVLALAVFGSARGQDTAVSPHSDLDLLLITTDEGLADFFPTVDWLQPFGILYAFEQHQNALTHATRLCYQDMRRIDVVVMTAASLQQYDSARFWQPCRLVLSRDTAVSRQLLQPTSHTTFSLPSSSEFDHMVNQFWYRSTVAVYKVIQDDLLIAWHLTLELIQECCILGMMLRDRQEQTNYHGTGGTGNEIVAQLPTWSEPYTAKKILVMITETATLFDDLARQWSERYEAKKRPLLNWIQSIQTPNERSIS